MNRILHVKNELAFYSRNIIRIALVKEASFLLQRDRHGCGPMVVFQ